MQQHQDLAGRHVFIFFFETFPFYDTQMGRRIGVTEETDCLSLIVSEETGTISIASSGDIRQDVTLDEAEESLARHFRREKSSTSSGNEGAAAAASNETRWKEAGPS